ncbi:unnamed protein product [Adineta steineri]|uniref:ADP ribosyltransferase domain-containing protein n=3 Tax=Adineta steineri TaxID=433720 RepID=A0A815PZ91_9BILA|nr:unnamed protein product [Adineta steineri]CAF1179347.1 unnamed protein product [Adineta steineri]CAF1456454.1 unnamed protein product [Adineta steineri]CAF1467105.1 unnamed protein product [Adineta steineri]CAF1467356.1 unnamed protein product [Adineta steineri]
METTLPNTTEADPSFEIYSLIWLDSSVNDSSQNIQAQNKLRQIINHLKVFEDDQQCLRYIQSLNKHDRVFFIVNGKLGQLIVPKLARFTQIISIYIYCFNQQTHQQWAQYYPKIKGVFTKFSELMTKIKSEQVQRHHSKIDDSLLINIFNSGNSTEEQSTSDLNGEFLHSQLLIDCLIRMKSSARDEDELVHLCKQLYKDNRFELKILKEFQRQYSPDQSLWWYTRHSFLHRLLNKALRVQNIDLLYLFRFFIRDIEQQLEKNKCQVPIRVYRAQVMSKGEIQLLRKSVGKIISMNSFLSTSLSRHRARSFLSLVDVTLDVEQVFFEIDADPRIENIKPFSNITALSYYPDEEEILFMVGSIFKINKIRKDSHGIWIIQMSLCSFDDHQLQSLFQHMKNEPGEKETNLLKFSRILRKMGKFEYAEKYLLRLVNQLTRDHPDIVDCYFQLGSVAYHKGDYEASLKWHRKLLEFDMQTLDVDHPRMASNYNSIATVYAQKGDYEAALDAFNKALTICKRIYGENHYDVASCLNNMGNVYQKEKRYYDALDFYQKSLAIWEKCLPDNHPHLGDSYGNIGVLQRFLGNKDLSLEYFQKSLQIRTKSLPAQHPDIAFTLRNIGLAYEDKGDIDRALAYYKKAAAVLRYSFISTHPYVTEITNDIQRVSNKQN